MRLKIFSILFLCGFTLSGAYSLQYNPFLLQTKDKKGETLAKALDKVYGDKITVKDGRCYFFEKQAKGADLEYEIDRCRMDSQQQTIYSQADRLNGIEIKGTIWIEGNSYRTRPYNGKWSEWKSSELFPGLHWINKTGYHFEKRNGEFQFKPTPGIKNIRGTNGYISESKSKAIRNGEEAGIVIQESGSGKIVIQESR
jgi:hypothetical protein